MSNTISTKEYSNISLRFNEMFEKGIKLAQKYSGDVWTDYNYHDPGVTILEYMIYSLMDLSYRTNLPVEDLFFLGVDQFDNVENNLLYSPHMVFPSDPYTVLDYRKMIIDRIKTVKNTWVNPIHDDPSGHKGLYEILVQSREELDDEGKEKLKKEVSLLFHQNRNLGNDLGRLKLLNEIPLTIIGKINIDIDAIGEYVMAKIYSEIDEYINPEVSLQNPFDLIEEGHATDEIFSGPRPVHGFIHTKNLKPKADSLFVSRIRDIISNIEGVKNIVNLNVLRKGILVHEDQITFEPESYPIIEYQGLSINDEQHVQLFKNNIELDIDPITTQQLIDFDLASKRNNYLGKIQYKSKLPKGKFTPAEIIKHYAIHNEFPSTYGLGLHTQIAQSDSHERKAQAKQLSAYLSFFEQIVANHLAQVTHVRELLSIDQNTKNTYFTQYPDDIPHFDELLFDDPATYKKYLEEISNDENNYYPRMNRVLDHLLARFSEYIDADALKKYALQNSTQDRNQIEQEIINTKIRFLKNIIELSTSRNTAFNYKNPSTWGSDNISKLELKLALSLNIENSSKRSLVRPLLEWMGMKKNATNQENEWYEETIEHETNLKFTILRLTADAYVDNEIRFPKQNISFISHLFSNAINPKFLRIIETKKGGNSLFHVLFRGLDPTREILIYEDTEFQKCELLIEKFKNKLFELNKSCEGFHMIEHILLRPLEPVFFTFNILDQSGKIFISGYYPGSLSSQNILSDEIPLLGSKSENYSIVSEDENMTFQVILYDSNIQPVAKLQKEYSSRVGAEKALENAVLYLNKLNNREILLNQVLEITATDNKLKDVPDNFIYSNSISFVLPSWPNRFQNQEFIQLFKRLITENIPAHFTADIYLLDPEKLSRFEEIFNKWLLQKSEQQINLKELDLLSIQLIQILVQLKNNESM